jgi:alkane 1-monooxygenase
MKRLKYFLIFLLPITVGIAFESEGLFSFIPLVVFFGLVPLLELLIPKSWNTDEASETDLAKPDLYYNLLLYSLVPLQWIYLFYFLSHQNEVSDSMTWWGRILAMGLMCGIIGINVGHELGHRNSKFERFLGELLLLSSLENHFLPYHNRGHHTNVGTPQDPASARRNEILFAFWFRSQIGSYIQAWQIEIRRMEITKQARFSLQNKMVVYTIGQSILLIFIFWFFGKSSFYAFVGASVFGILLLETVNYIEHYGLARQKKPNGQYELVKRHHSWNSNHLLGRAILFELSRHSEHHYKPDKPYQLLNRHESAPNMPTGYPGMMLLAFIPPIFFRIMNKAADRALSVTQ